MRIPEATTFLKSFENTSARDFVQKMMIQNYTDAILGHHPRASSLNRDEIHQKCQHLVETAFQRIKQIQAQPKKLFPLFHQLSRKNPQPDPMWFAEFNEAYQHYKHHRKLYLRLEQLKPFLKGKSYADVGCGGGDLVAFLKKEYPQFEEYAGIDVLDWRTEAVKGEINFQMLDFSQPHARSEVQYDLLTCIAVLHHVGHTDEAQSIFLQNLHTALSKNGRLIIEEDVLMPPPEVQANHDYQKQTQALSQKQPLFAEFLQFSEANQRDITILIDFLANCLANSVPEMAFPCGFRTLEGWRKLFAKNSFELETVAIQGYVEGIFNRSGHVFFVLKPITISQ